MNDLASPQFPPPQKTGTAFVCGAGGFIGGHVVSALKKAGWKVAALGNAGSHVADNAAITSITGPISDELLDAARAQVGVPELILHAAGGSTVASSVSDPYQDFKRTVDSTAAVLSFVRRSSPEARLIFLSSAAVYGRAQEGAISEGAARAPISPYGVHKALSEDLIRAWSDLYGLSTSIVRLFSVYGPNIRKQLIWELTQKFFAKPKKIQLFGTGDEIRDFLHVADVVQMIGKLARAPEQKSFVVNAGTGRGVTIRQLADMICKAAGSEAVIEFNRQSREGDPPSLLANIERAKTIGFTPQVKVEDGIAEYVAWFSAHAPRK